MAWPEHLTHGHHGPLRPTQADFRRALLSVTEVVVAPSDCNILAFRMRGATTPEEVRSCDDVVRPSPTNAAADGWT